MIELPDVGWYRDELILLIATQQELGKTTPKVGHPRVTELQDLLTELATHLTGRSVVRTAKTIAREISELSGTTNNGVAARAFRELTPDRATLNKVASAIKRASSEAVKWSQAAREERFPEGILLMRAHRAREEAIGSPTARHCEHCGLDPEKQFGAAAGDVLELHDCTEPYRFDAELDRGNTVTVCPTCHAVLHGRRPWMNRRKFKHLDDRMDHPVHVTARGRHSASIQDLGLQAADYLERRQRDGISRFAYHPRTGDLNRALRDILLADLLAASPPLRLLAEQGQLSVEPEGELDAGRGDRKKVDILFGVPERGLVRFAEGTKEPLRRATVGRPLMCVEIKMCMTEHLKSTTRLGSELSNSLRIIRDAAPDAEAVALVLINVADRFTSPLNLPGPNLHDQPMAARRLIDEIVKRMSGPNGYDLLAVATLNFDNETTPLTAPPEQWGVPQEHTYESVVSAAAAELVVRANRKS